MPLPRLRTPSEFIDYYFRQLKSTMGSNNFKLTKTGFVGFILNILGNTQYDVKQYYDSLFNEAFPVTALDNTNLAFHSALHNYKPSFAKSASVATGRFDLILSELPTIQSGIVSRTISFGATTTVVGSTLKVGVDLGGVLFTSNDLYTLTAKLSGNQVLSYYSETISPTKHVNSFVNLNQPSLNMVDVSQISDSVQIIQAPYYIPGTHYTMQVTPPSADSISSIGVTVLNKVTNISTVFTVSNNKTIYGPTDTVIFYSIKPDNSVSLELGSGVNGIYIPTGSTITVTLSLTKGASGNVSPTTSSTISISKDAQFTQSVTVVDDYGSGNRISTLIDIHKFLVPSISVATGGVDILSGNSLRAGLIRYIQSSDYLISTLDYDNYLSTIFNDYYVSFSKVILSDNTMNLHVPVMNKFNMPYPTDTVTVPRTIFEATKYSNPSNGDVIVYESHVAVNGRDMATPFYYTYDSLLRAYRASVLTSPTTFNYNSIKSVTPAGATVTTGLPYVHIIATYYHSTPSPFTILSLQSYENLTQFATLPSSTSIKISSPAITLNSNTPQHIIPITKKSGIQSNMLGGINNTVATIPVTDVTVFPINGTILIGTEEISYTGRNLLTNELTGCARGINGTVSAPHLLNDIVFDISVVNDTIDFIFGVISTSLTSNITTVVTTIPLNSTTYFPPSGTVLIGTEEIIYTGKTAISITGCTRGSNATVAATHVANDIIYETTTYSAALATPALFNGIIPTTTPLTVTLNVSGGNTTDCSFSVTQLNNISDFLTIKEFTHLSTTADSTTTLMSTASTSVTLGSVALFNITGGFAKIGNEYIAYASITGTVLNGVTRALNGSIAVSHASSSPIYPMTFDELSVPVIDYTQYNTDRLFVGEKMKSQLSSLTIPINRTISDDVQSKFLNTSTLSLIYASNMVSNGNLYTSSILFPLKVSVDLLIDSKILTSSGADLALDIAALKVTLATELLAKYTSIRIRISDADLIVICKLTSYIDDANVTFTDSATVPYAIPNNQIHVKADSEILKGMSKTERLNFVPPLWYWDVNNITITYTIQ